MSCRRKERLKSWCVKKKRERGCDRNLWWVDLMEIRHRGLSVNEHSPCSSASLSSCSHFPRLFSSSSLSPFIATNYFQPPYSGDLISLSETRLLRLYVTGGEGGNERETTSSKGHLIVVWSVMRLGWEDFVVHTNTIFCLSILHFYYYYYFTIFLQEYWPKPFVLVLFFHFLSSGSCCLFFPLAPI